MAHQLETCPYCGNPQCHAEWCDVSVGFVQMGPYHCDACGATEIGPYDEKRPLSAVERSTGWYQQGHLPDTVSSINGQLVVASEAKRIYERGAVDHVPFRLQLPVRQAEALRKIGCE